MGCDIHMSIEYRPRSGVEWSAFSDGEIDCPRHYRMFGAMAGVRDYEGNQMFAPRGLPSDLSQETYGMTHHTPRDGGGVIEDFHTFSWLSPDDFRACVDKIGGSCVARSILAAMDAMVDGGMEVRLIFWFDC